jgi:predicted outer membrane repeat protein
MKRLIFCAVVAALPAAPNLAPASMYTVDDSGGADYLTIGEAVAACSEGDTVYVMPGTYAGAQNRGIDFDSTNLVIMSDAGASQTIIDCEGVDRAFCFMGAQDTTTVIQGLRIVNGYGWATPPYISGGAIYLHSGASAIIRNCQFDANTAANGGAMMIGNGNNARIRDCVFTNNMATDEYLGGGAIHGNYDDSIVSGCFFQANSAYEGGAIWLYYSHATVKDCQFEYGNSVLTYGGGVYVELSPDVSIEGCTFAGNVAQDGAAIGAFSSPVLITGCTFTSNEAVAEGGGIWAQTDGVGPTVTWSTFQTNAASHGGAADVVAGGPVTFSHCTFESNTTSNSSGALYLVVDPDDTFVTDCTFTSNSTTGHGGAVWANGVASLDVAGCVFTGNDALYDGGAVDMTLTVGIIEETTFDGNTCGGRGGGANAQSVMMTFDGCTFSGNTATSQGGGLAMRSNSYLWMTGCTVHENTAQMGGGVYWDGSTGTIRATTIEGNAGLNGGGVYYQGEDATIEETIVAFSTEGAGIIVSGPGPEITHCCVYGNAAGDSLGGNYHHNMFLDPLFCDAASDDYTLCADSPCAESNNSWDLLIGAHDIGCPDCGDPVDDESWGTIKAMFR